MSLILYSTRNIIFLVNSTATTEIYTLSLHDALPISAGFDLVDNNGAVNIKIWPRVRQQVEQRCGVHAGGKHCRSEEHTSELQSQSNLVCRLLLEKKNIITQYNWSRNIHTTILIILYT